MVLREQKAGSGSAENAQGQILLPLLRDQNDSFEGFFRSLQRRPPLEGFRKGSAGWAGSRISRYQRGWIGATKVPR
jgi:hypothetical protein